MENASEYKRYTLLVLYVDKTIYSGKYSNIFEKYWSSKILIRKHLRSDLGRTFPQ